MKNCLSDSSGMGTLSRPILLFSRIRVLRPNVGMMNCNSGIGLKEKRSGSSILTVSYF